jgi:gentisate 1,2-dioxygenase
MKSITTTSASHYDIQKGRRGALLEEWRGYHKTVVSRGDVRMIDVPSRRERRGVYVGRDGDRPTMNLDATVHEIASGSTTTIHRHSWDAIAFVESGRGWTEVDGERFEWRPWDTYYLPAWSWHRHGSDGDTPAVFLTWSVEPMMEQLGAAIVEEGGDTPVADLPPPPRPAPDVVGDDPYARRLQRLATQPIGSVGTRLLTRFEDVRGVVSKRGARSLFLVDKAIGYRTAGLSVVMHELAPGRHQSRHRHGGDAFLYVVKGNGYSTIDDVKYEWHTGDLIVVDHWVWHQHVNSDASNTARLIRIHNSDALYDMIRVLLDPLDLLEEPKVLDAPDLTGVEWPDHLEGRPEI